MLAVAVLERDVLTGTALFAWRYPDLSLADEAVIVARSGLERDAVATQFSFSRFASHWFYIWTIAKPAALPALEAFAVVVVRVPHGCDMSGGGAG